MGFKKVSLIVISHSSVIRFENASFWGNHRSAVFLPSSFYGMRQCVHVCCSLSHCDARNLGNLSCLEGLDGCLQYLVMLLVYASVQRVPFLLTIVHILSRHRT